MQELHKLKCGGSIEPEASFWWWVPEKHYMFSEIISCPYPEGLSSCFTDA